MKSLLLIAFVSLLRAACTSESAIAGGFYLDRALISAGQACTIMFDKESFQRLPLLSTVTPLNEKDMALLVQGVSLESGRIDDLKGLWKRWIVALQLPESHPTVWQYGLLYCYLLVAATIHLEQLRVKLQARKASLELRNQELLLLIELSRPST